MSPRATEGLLTDLLAFFAKAEIFNYDADAVAIDAQLLASVRRLGTMDRRIAAICLVQGATLVTGNGRDFGQVPGLAILDWRAGHAEYAEGLGDAEQQSCANALVPKECHVTGEGEDGTVDVRGLPDRLTVYARVAFLLCVAEHALAAQIEDPGYQVTRRAFDLAVRWLAGEHVRGVTLAELLLFDDEGILIYEQMCTDPNRINAYLSLEWVLSYVSWHASVQVGDYPEALVAEVTEDVIASAVHQAATVDSYDERYVQRVRDYLLERYSIEGGDVVGRPIALAEVNRQALG